MGEIPFLQVKQYAVPPYISGHSIVIQYIQRNRNENRQSGAEPAKHYNADQILHSVFFYGKPDKKFIDCYKAVLDANQTAIENITDKTFTNDADAFARDLLIKDGIGENFTHSLGHGVGLEIHEYPTLSPKKRQKLENGMVFTIEPGVYFAGEFGIRIEDVVMLKDGKTIRLYTDDKNLKIL